MSAEEHEEHVVSIVASLVKNCKGAHKQRIMTKFTEADHEKVERLMELHFKYLDKVGAADARSNRDDDDEDDDEDQAYLRRLDHGLFTLQLVDLILAEVCSASGAASSVKQRVLQILQQRKGSVTDIRNVLREYAGNLGDGDAENGDGKGAERQYLLDLVDKF